MRLPALTLALAFVATVGCNNGGGFAGGSGEQAPADSKDEPEAETGTKPKGKGTSTTDTAAATATDVDAANDPNAAGSAPTYAVKDGPFKAWAVPQAPADKQDYQIFIQLTLPANVKAQSLTKSDLSGLLKSSDGFELKLEKVYEPIPPAVPIAVPFDPRGKFEAKGSLATLSFWVPYSLRHPSDTLTVHSKALNEDASLTIDFQ